jgi:outer membrane protein insertion porin family
VHYFIISLLVSLISATTALAEPVQSIKINGNIRVENETILSYIGVNEGNEYVEGSSSRMIKSLYNTGLFDQVDIQWKSGVLSVSILENPVVNKVVFEGNDEIDDDRLRGQISLHSRAVYTTGKVQRDVKSLLTTYRQTGRFLSKVTPQIIERDQNRVDVIYNIAEGEKTKIKDIRFVGNKRFGDSDLESVIRTRESSWWRFLSSADVYDADRVEVDKELLRRYYIKHGHADFRVTSAVTELSRDKKNFYITFAISEGPLYDFGEIDVALNIDEEDLKKEDLKELLAVVKNNRFDGSLVETDVDKLIDALGAKGFAFLDVNPQTNTRESERLVDVTFNIQPGPRVYVNRVNVTGNNRTRENVVRRELRFAEGDAFSTSKIQRSRDRLTYLGFFDDVSVKHKETQYPDRLDLDINVSEQSTGEFNVGAGYSTYESFLATADVRERNFLGKGQDMSLSFALSSKRQDFNFSFTEPWFMGKEIGAGIDLFNERRDLQSESSYDLGNTGGAVRFGFALNEFVKDTVRIGFKETEISNVDAGASIFTSRDEGKRSTITIGNQISRDTRDSYVAPTKGHRLSLGVDYSGFGSDINYIRSLATASWHKEVKEGWVLSLGGRAGFVTDIDGPLPIYEHFNAGGSTLRGFTSSGIGPRDRTTDDALGGKYLVANNIELTFPIPGLDEMGINGLIFSDGGIVTQFEDHTNVVDSKLYRVSAGVGMFWRSPMGPLRFEFGFPIVKATEDRTEVFSFSMGTRF